MRYFGLSLLLAAPSAFSFTATTPSSVEPASLALLLSGVIGVFVLRHQGK